MYTGHENNCIICGKPLVYSTETVMRECCVCHKVFPSDAACEDGHFVCDSCHSGGGTEILAHLQQSTQRDPIALFTEVCSLPGVHMHGPEHHSIVPCVLLTAYKNCGGDIDLPASLSEAWTRGKKIPGGACGFLGVCGAAAGTGIFISILTGDTPLAGEAWAEAQRMTARALNAIAGLGGPRCCKRDGRLAIAEAVKYVRERFGIGMPLSRPACTFCGKNSECLRSRCPFFPAGGE